MAKISKYQIEQDKRKRLAQQLAAQGVSVTQYDKHASHVAAYHALLAARCALLAVSTGLTSDSVEQIDVLVKFEKEWCDKHITAFDFEKMLRTFETELPPYQPDNVIYLADFTRER